MVLKLLVIIFLIKLCAQSKLLILIHMHWQPMNGELKRIIPEIQWEDTLSSEETFETY